MWAPAVLWQDLAALLSLVRGTVYWPFGSVVSLVLACVCIVLGPGKHQHQIAVLSIHSPHPKIQPIEIELHLLVKKDDLLAPIIVNPPFL